MMAKLKDTGVATAGAATSTYAGRIDGFTKSVQSYQSALLQYRDTLQSSGRIKHAAKLKAHNAFDQMQRQFQKELHLANGRTKARRGTPLTSSQRAVNIATSSRNVTKLKVLNQVEASNLVKFTKYARFLGNGLAVIDFTDRVGKVHNEYQAGGNWERELFIESSSFAASAITGTLAVKGGLALMLVATPVGWVGLIGGLAIVGAAAGASMVTNSYFKENSGAWYDRLMQLL